MDLKVILSIYSKGRPGGSTGDFEKTVRVIVMDTKNIKFVAYLRMIDIHPDSVKKIARGKASYSFSMDEKRWGQLKQAFSRSEFIKYGQCIDAVIDLAY